MNDEKYNSLIAEAISHFWKIRLAQSKNSKKSDTGNRSSVTGGKQLDGFVSLFKDIAIEAGIPDSWIYDKSTTLPGYFRPTKNWDLVIVSEKRELVAVCEIKSQVGSFGNNFNNRTEEVLGSAVDFWTAYKEDGFGDQRAPWLGYLIIVEIARKSTRPVRLSANHFDARPEFKKTSYLQRYDLLCKKLTTERHYTVASLIGTKPDYSFENVSDLSSIQTFIRSFVGHISSYT